MKQRTTPTPNEERPLVVKKFNSFTLGLFAFILPNVWAFAATGLAIGIYGGGLPVLIWSSFFVGIVLSVLVVSFAEFGSAYPSVAGCLLIASKLGGPKYGRICGFLTGGIHALASVITPSCLVAANTPFITTTAMILNPGWVPKKWHTFLIYQAGNIMITLTCLRGSRFLDKLALAGGLVTFLLLFTSIGVIVGGPDELASSEVVWSKTENLTGWPTGLAFLLGAASPLSGYGPTHWVLNMAEDVKNPRRAIPIAFLMQQAGSVITLFGFFVAIGYGVGADWEIIVTSPYTAPMGAVFEQTSGSKAAAAALMVLMISFAIVSGASYTSATCRLVYGFTKSEDLPLRSWLTHYDEKNQIPTNIVYVTFGVSVILGTLELGSSSGLNTLVGAAVVLFTIGYLPMFVGYLLTGGRHLGNRGWFRLPRSVSLCLAAFNTLSILVQCIALCLPPANPITLENMNWASAVAGAIIIIVIVVYFVYGRGSHEFGDDLLILDDDIIVSVESHNPGGLECRKMSAEK